MSENILTIPQIVENLREMPERFEAHNKFGPLLVLDVRNLADRIEAAHEREVDGYKGRIKLWCDRADELRSKCDEQYAELKHKREATCEKSSQVGNNAKMRKALKYLRDASREFHHLILNSKHNEICDNYKYPEVAKIRDAIANANAALSAPPRNCDLYNTKDEAREAFQKLRGHCILADVSLWDDRDEIEEMFDWLFAEAKGENR